MTSTAATVTVGQHALPLVVFFEADDAARRSLVGINRFRRIAFESLPGQPAELARVLVTTSEKLLQQNYGALRAPNARVIALCDTHFRDARIDGAVYAYLPTKVPTEFLERILDNALDHIHLLVSRAEINQRLAGAKHEIHELNQIGAALSAEHDTAKLLEMILSKCRDITHSDAGSLYLVETEELPPEHAPQVAVSESSETETIRDLDPRKMLLAHYSEKRRKLRFKLAQNDSVPVNFEEVTVEIDDHSIAGYVALTGESVNIADAYHLPAGVPYAINRTFDEDSGYRTKSILAVPMRNPKGEVVGVVQLINAKRERGARLDSISAVANQVMAYSSRVQEIVASLASQAAVALENSRLYEAIQRLFEGFVRASVIAIEARDPATSGHSFRVANLTVALAEAVDRTSNGPYAAVRFSRNAMREIRYASLLHDFGKVGVREEILVKAKKLYPGHLELIRQRFQFIKSTLENESLRARLECVEKKGEKDSKKKLAALNKKLAEQLAAADTFLDVIRACNEPSVLPEGNFRQLLKIAGLRYSDFDGKQQPLLTPEEVQLLSIRQGSLDHEERKQIEAHVVHTVNFLNQIPWTPEIRNIPGIARGHHEKLNGQGYPYKLTAPEIPVQTRMMTLADIFDALAAADRPYKRAITVEKALDILKQSVEEGELDAALFRIFLEAKVFQRWKIEPFPY